MTRRTHDEIANLNSNVAKALGNSKSGKSLAEIVSVLDGEPNKTHVRAALRACGAVCLGKTRAARYYSAKAVEKYGQAELEAVRQAA